MVHKDFKRKISGLRGPVLVLDASGFVGVNLLRTILSVRDGAYVTAFGLPAWRLEGVPKCNVIGVDLLVLVRKRIHNRPSLHSAGQS